MRSFYLRDSSELLPKAVPQLVGIMNQLRQLEAEGKLNRTPHVEDAMRIMLQVNGIIIPREEFMQFAKDFKPSEAAGAH